MRRREFLRKCILSTGAVTAAPMLNFGRCRLSAAGTEREYSVRTIDLVGRSLVIDMLGLLTLDYGRLRNWHADPATFTTSDFARLSDSGIGIFHPAVDLNGTNPYSDTLAWLEGWNRLLAAHPGQLVRIDTCSDVETARTSDRIGVLLGMQNSEHFRTAADVQTFYDLGQRVSQLTYNGENRIGYGCTERRDLGLTPFGANIVRAMNTAGMVVDVSHAGEQTTLDTFEASTRPVLITHANCKTLTPHPRCKSDEIIRALARQGGVMGITSIRAFVRQRDRATVREALDHFDHAARLVGPEHVGLGSDTDVEQRSRNLDVAGLNHPRRVFDIAEGLLQRRHKESDVELILGGNFRRALGTIFC
jgi:membrane dipeptidase